MTSPPTVGAAWPGSSFLVTDTRAPALSFDAGLGQRVYSFRFELVNAVSGEHLGDIHPIRTAALTHDTTRTSKRQLNFALTAADLNEVNPLTDRVSPFMVIPGIACPDTDSGDWPLGKYMWVDETDTVTTAGNPSSDQLWDEMWLVDQVITKGLNGVGRNTVDVIFAAIEGLPIVAQAEPSTFTCAQAWGVGSARGQILESLATAGDFWSPWFDNLGRLRYVRTFNPANRAADIDLDVGARVVRNSITTNSQILTAPNVIIVTSNNSATGDPAVGISRLPPSAPNSVANRGFEIAQTYDLQLSDATQAQAVADGIMQRLSVFQVANLATLPDPRYDGYNVVRWQSINWLSLAWSLPMTPGALMTHVMRRSYRG